RYVQNPALFEQIAATCRCRGHVGTTAACRRGQRGRRRDDGRRGRDMTPNDRRFTAVDDDSLAGMIRNAAQRVGLVALALGKATAQALLDVVDPEGQCPAVDIVRDADEDTCRLGYGDPDGIEILQKG